MKKFALVLVAALAATGAVASDLPARSAAPEPVMISAGEAPRSWYVGVNAGSTAGVNKLTFGEARSVFGAVVGYEYNRFLRSEVSFTYRYDAPLGSSGQMATVNGIIQYPIAAYGITPYVLAGVGAGWNDYGDVRGRTAALYNLGGGMRYALTQRIELDGRYRYVSQFRDGFGHRGENLLTAGVNYRF